MSTRQKVMLVGLLVLVVALFVVAVGGRSPGKGDPVAHNGFVSWLSGLGGSRATVDPATVSGDCVQPDHTAVLTVACVLHVADPGALKNLVLRSATAFQVTAPAPGKADYTANSRIDPDKNGVAQTKVAVDKAADVAVACVGTPSCVLTIAGK